MELANKEDFRDASVPVDDTVNKVGKYASSGHSNEEAVIFLLLWWKTFSIRVLG